MWVLDTSFEGHLAPLGLSLSLCARGVRNARVAFHPVGPPVVVRNGVDVALAHGLPLVVCDVLARICPATPLSKRGPARTAVDGRTAGDPGGLSVTTVTRVQG